MGHVPGIRSPHQRTILVAAGLILLPGIVLGYLGFRSIANRAEVLRSSYSATVRLVRDRLEAEVDRLESAVADAADTFVAVPRAPGALATWLQARSAESPWLTDPFFFHRTGGVMTTSVSSGWPSTSADPLGSNERLRRLVREAETAEFSAGDLSRALTLYRQAARVATDALGRCQVLMRIGRVQLNAGRLREGITTYEEVLDLDGDPIGPTGAPCRVVALSQMSEGLARLGDETRSRETQRKLLERLVEAPWDLDQLYGFFLSRALEADVAPDALVARARERSEAVRRAEWIRFEVGPRLRVAVSSPNESASGHAHLQALQNETPVQLGYRIFEAREDDGEVVAFGYVIRADYVGSVLLPRLLESVDIGGDLALGIVDEQGQWRSGDAGLVHDPDRPAGDEEEQVLAVTRFQSTLPGWTLTLLDREGRSISEVVGRENRVYGGLMIALVLVLAVGVAFTLRAAAHEVELSRLKAEFVANVTHELKTPLALIRMYGETLEGGLVTEPGQQREFFAIIRRESERLTQLINNVLDFGRIETGSKEYSFAGTNIVDLVRDSVDAYRSFFDRAAMTVETDFPDGPIPVAVDRDAITLALVNLLSNALKYGADGGHVHVWVRLDGGDVLIGVTDRGVGIPADQLERIFEKYHRLDNGGAAGAPGNGLGLAIVKHAVEGHLGRVEVTSAPGRGSTFIMRLPLDPRTRGTPCHES